MLAYFRVFLLVSITVMIAFILVQARKVVSSPTNIATNVSAAARDQQLPETVQIGQPALIDVKTVQPSREVGKLATGNNDQHPEELERIEALPQPTPPPQPKPIEPKKLLNHERWRLVYNTVATSAGVFQIIDNAFVLPGIDVVSADERCILTGGNSWPCGMVARTSLRSFINGKALTCKLPDIMTEKSFVANCTLRGRDLAQWLVVNGWARAKADGPYLADQADAELKRRGIYGTPPSGLTTLAQ
jgi:hypothetical protein